MRRTVRILAILLAALLHDAAAADAIVAPTAMNATSVMEAFLDDDVLRVEIEMGLADAGAFVNLMPPELYEQFGLPPVPLDERLRRFSTQDLVFTADGAPLIGRLARAEPRPRVVRDPISGVALPVAEGDAEAVVFFVIEYPLETRPRTITFKVPDDAAPGARASIGFVFYHLGVAVNDFRYLVTGATVDLDWDDPWHSRFRAQPMRRAYDAPMNVFLYVEPYEVRVEIIVRPLDAQQWVDLGLDRRSTIQPEDYGSIQGRVADFLAAELALTIDGEPVEPVLDRIHFLRRTLSTSTVIDPPQELSVYTAQLGVIFIVPRDGLPEEAELTWPLFSDKIQSVPCAATDEAGPLPYALAPDDNVLRWENFLTNPTVPTMVGVEAPPRIDPRLLSGVGWTAALGAAMALFWGGQRFARERTIPSAALVTAVVFATASVFAFAGRRTAVVDEDRSGLIVGTLLHNVYRSFDYRDEGAIYDALARSMTGDLLTRAYLDTKRSLELRDQGGARAKVNNVEVVTCVPRDAGGGAGFVADCRWNVTGSVGHWGHIHQRRNQYNALLTVRVVDGAWRLTEMAVISEERL